MSELAHVVGKHLNGAPDHDADGRWRVMSENILGFNLPEKFTTEGLLRDLPMDIAVTPDAFVSQREVLEPPGGRSIQRGAIYDSDGVLLPEFEMVSGLYPGRFDHPLTITGERKLGGTRIRTPSIYLGTLHGHFGHFLIESLARSWALSKADRDLGLVFHYSNFVGASDIETLFKGFPPYMRVCLESLGVDPARLIFANRDLRFDELLVPRAQFWIYQFADRGMTVPYDVIRQTIQRQSKGASAGPKRVYLTRQKLEDTALHKIRKNVANEDQVERLFLARGFESVALEKLPFSEQVMVMANATHIAGTTGSALHMAMFSARPGAELIGIDWRNSRTQYVLDAARGLNSRHIYCLQDRNAKGIPLVDVDVVEAALKDLSLAVRARRAAIRARDVEELEIGAVARHDASASPDAKSPSKPANPSPAAQAPTLSSEEGVTLFKSYWRVRPERTSMARQSPALWILLNAIQTQAGVEGDILDVGVGLGATALLGLLLLKEGERGVGADERRHSAFDGGLQALPATIRERSEFIKLKNKDAPLEGWSEGRFRMAHIDMQVDAASILRRVEQVSPFVKDDGVLILNHFFEPSSPDVTIGVCRLLDQSEWKAILIGFNKIYLVRSAHQQAYHDALAREAEAYLAPFGVFAVKNDVKLAADLVSSIKGNIHAALMSR